MTPQQIFDTVARHLLTQNKRAKVGNQCRYRTQDGLKCAVGCLIPDDLYDPAIETDMILSFGWLGHVRRKLGDDKANALLNQLGPHENLLMGLQCIHDRSLPHEWPAQLERLATLRDLSTAVLSEFPTTSTT